MKCNQRQEKDLPAGLTRYNKTIQNTEYLKDALKFAKNNWNQKGSQIMLKGIIEADRKINEFDKHVKPNSK